MPQIPHQPLIIRIGAAGPLQLRNEAREEVSKVLSFILTGLKRYADNFANKQFDEMMFHGGQELPPAQLRFVSQLASGADQMGASIAVSIGYRLHVVLPGARTAFENDIERNLRIEKPGTRKHRAVLAERPTESGEENVVAGTLSQFRELIDKADRVLELDRDDESSHLSEFTPNDYAQAGSIILNHSDVILVVVHEEKSAALGGTRWLEQKAEEQDLPLIRIPVERPSDALLIWTGNSRRESRNLFDGGDEAVGWRAFEAALDQQLLGPKFDLAKTQLGWPARNMVAQLDMEYNSKSWDTRWNLPESSDALAAQDLGHAAIQVNDDFKAVKVWADHRASAMAELVRGSFIVSAFLGIFAAVGALIGFLLPYLATRGKCFEIVCFALILGLMFLSRRQKWGSQWLSLRQLERYVDQAAWLQLLGRARMYTTPPLLGQFQTDEIAIWVNAYFRAVIRGSSFPTAHFTPNYLKTVHALALENLIVNQISYFENEALFQDRADKALESYTMLCVGLALAFTIVYLLLVLLLPARAIGYIHEVMPAVDPGAIVGVLGAILATAAAAFSAIRNHGEYAQTAARFDGARESLQKVQGQLTAWLPNRRPDFSPPPLRSSSLASMIGSATDILVEEVSEWRAILQKKQIEPT